jgi:hypothetical protein
MRELTYYIATSLDGFIAHGDGSHAGFSEDPAYLQALFSGTVPLKSEGLKSPGY